MTNESQQPDVNPKRDEKTIDEDAQLMLRFRDGDESAFEQLVRRNVGHVHALIYRFLRDPAVVDDVTQDVFLRIYRNAARYEPTAKFSTWLYRITANLCFNVTRSRKKGRPVSLDTVIEDEAVRRDVPDEAQPSPSAGLDAEELQREIARAIGELPEQQRAAILLNKYENRNYEDIAAVLETTPAAVKSLLSRARANLRESLKRYVEEE
ncbi:MAG: sigma-70 family RNA polymerase sigma factor [Phycisphaerae bacterium]|nr:sigma-70 family RNA polymerase sigma factor [Phycisphaerae bacterium]